MVANVVGGPRCHRALDPVAVAVVDKGGDVYPVQCHVGQTVLGVIGQGLCLGDAVRLV